MEFRIASSNNMSSGCCGFWALRWILVLLNSIYIGISLFLIGVVIAARTLAYDFTNVPIMAGVGVVAAVLFVVAVLGMVGILRHNQIVMFFYMVLLGLSGVALFSVSVGALAIPRTWRSSLFNQTWNTLSEGQRSYIQDNLNCCGFDNTTKGANCNSTALLRGCCKNLTDIHTKSDSATQCLQCSPCYGLWEESVSKGVKLAGGLGLIFSFTQIAGIILTFRYRNLKDPNVNPRDYL